MHLVLTIILLIPVPSSPLSCWECLTDCEDPQNLKVEECMEDVQHCLMLKLDGAKTLTCSPDPPAPGQDGCREKGATVQCFCDTDLCNGGQGLVGAVGVLMGALLVTMLVV